jgi:hypothetical protein
VSSRDADAHLALATHPWLSPVHGHPCGGGSGCGSPMLSWGGGQGLRRLLQGLGEPGRLSPRRTAGRSMPRERSSGARASWCEGPPRAASSSTSEAPEWAASRPITRSCDPALLQGAAYPSQASKPRSGVASARGKEGTVGRSIVPDASRGSDGMCGVDVIVREGLPALAAAFRGGGSRASGGRPGLA